MQAYNTQIAVEPNFRNLAAGQKPTTFELPVIKKKKGTASSRAPSPQTEERLLHDPLPIVRFVPG